MAIVSVENLKMSYDKGRVKALKGVTFDVEEGEIFGLIGPDGAGKTSLFRILTTLLLADSGKAVVDGMDVVNDYKKIRRHIGYMPGRFSLYQDLTVEENLSFFATVFNTTIEENYHLVEDIYRQIEPFKKRKAGKLSGGMKQKLALSCALIHAPHVLFLDEPTTGVDPVSRKEFWEMLQKLKKNFKLSIVVSTPYMDEALQCDRIALIQDGQFLTIDTPENIIRAYTQTLWSLRSDKMHRLLTDLRSIDGVKTAFAFGENHHATIDTSVLTVDSLRNRLVGLGHRNIVIEVVEPTIEDCFMNLQK
ncbi:ABC transporter ATP-binding protein [Bacteroides ovatus]|jgi:ABC-2 type transport system ATP-binding protein|uniref:ABC transporter ATP-binding protein n=1 Tax=Bacteroides TaxID=816 RepID=UPI00237ADD36|nr:MULTISPECIES: ABC transporter ATP-binding protein [Bacteroides]MDW7580061.1 ABC transporter ATP-binding protein [Bacteroides ovatus]